eukprot:TRINITY_DN21877_c0_g1_i1.p1 TRINITY_DN21877_c0_g1~~TRINITY_DN21877_c0_g1_i1.p1  ORF type:complete len:267 (+),score=38.37 TRINITY_DN21877_c0_g1_i1:70-870(+)
MKDTAFQASADLLCEIDVDFVCRNMYNCSLGKGSTCPLCVYVQRPRCTIKVWASGKALGKLVAVDGSEAFGRPEALKHAMKAVARRIKQLGHPGIRFKRYALTQVSGSHELGFLVDLLSLSRRPDAEWDASGRKPCVNFVLKPGLASVFADGEIRLTGAANVEQMNESLRNILPVVSAAACEQLCGPSPEPIGSEKVKICNASQDAGTFGMRTTEEIVVSDDDDDEGGISDHGGCVGGARGLVPLSWVRQFQGGGQPKRARLASHA